VGDTILYSVVVPVYNSAPLVARLYDRLVTVMQPLGTFELVFVDDCSTDASWAELAKIAGADRRVMALQLARNVGQGGATLYGIEQSNGKIIITLDDDLQHVPEEIPKLLTALDGPDGYDVVFGVPIIRHHPAWRRVGSWTVNLAFSLVLQKPLALRFTGFRALRRHIVPQLLALRWPDPFLSALLFQITPRIGVVHVEHPRSGLASSRYSIGKLARASFGYMGSLSDRERRNLAAGIGIVGTAFLALAWSSASFAAPFALIFVIAMVTLGAVCVLFLSLAAAVEWRLNAFRRSPQTKISACRIITDRRELVTNG
jgi:glycosyltransferase involved in cell wall biosynthesis